MKNTILALVLVGIAWIIASRSFGQSGGQTVPTKWEYSIVRDPTGLNVENILNPDGEKGWELVCVVPSSEKSDQWQYFMKRPK